MSNTEKKLCIARDEMVKRFDVTKADAELLLMIGAAVSIELAPTLEGSEFELSMDKDELHEIVERVCSR